MDFLVMSKEEKFYDYPPHHHDFWEVIINIEGSGTATIDDKTYPFRPGTIFCIHPGITHRKASPEGYVDGSVLIGDFCFKEDTSPVLVFQDDSRQSFYSLFKLAYAFPINPATDVYAERFLRSIVDAMQNLLSHWRNATGKNAHVLRVQKILADHVADTDFDINEAIRSTPYSSNYFRALFKEQCGCSPLHYYHELKVQFAKEQILQYKSILSISEIAQSCGFDDPYYFSRVFKKIAGVSPMEFYKKSREQIPRPII